MHGTRVVEHEGAWEGWLRGDDADGHFAPRRGTAMAVTIADCVPVFIAHPSGAIALLHSGWRGTAARIIESRDRGVQSRRGCAPASCDVHLGPAICGACYEVSADVATRSSPGRDRGPPTHVDLRALIADHARDAGVRDITTSRWCTRCDNDALLLASRGRCGSTARRDRGAHVTSPSG